MEAGNAKQDKTWHKVTLKQQYPHLDGESCYVCDCGDTEPVELEPDEWRNVLALHKGRWALDFDDEAWIDRIIADHAARAVAIEALEAIAGKHGPNDYNQYCLEVGTHKVARAALAKLRGESA